MPDLSQRLRSALASRYRIERMLGRGGMATVFLAEDLRHHRSVAIKVFDPEVADTIGPERFLREIETVAKLTHPHILPLHDSGEADRLLFYVMPYVEGESLRDRLRREKRLPIEDSLRIACDVADALDFAHRHGVVHRDIKPENILLEERHALVADFGIARAFAAAGPKKLTTSGVIVGTPSYMSPEQVRGSHDLDGRSDEYSLGCMVYEMLAGQPPFAGPTVESLAYQHLTVEPRPVSELRPGVPAAVDRALKQALAKTPAARFSSVAEFAAAIARAADRSHTAPRRRIARQLVLAAISVLVALVAVAAWRGWHPFSEWLGGGRAHLPTTKDWILVAEFDATPPDPSLAVAARQLVIAGLDRSKVFGVVPNEQLKLALELAGKSDSTRVDGSLARELAFRNGIKVVLEGRIDRLGKASSVLLSAKDSDDGRVIRSVAGQARDQESLIPVIGRLSQELAEYLAARRGALVPAGFRWTAATPSFEAYRKYAEAFEMQQLRGDDRGSLVLIREALRLDPDFAEAWALKMFAHGHLGEGDSSRAAMDEALRRPQRLTPEGRMFLQALKDWVNGDLASADAAYQELIRRGYQLSSSLGNRGAILWTAGRYEEALESYRRAAGIGPFGAQQWVLQSEIELLLMFGRVDEARMEARKLQGWCADYMQLAIAMAAGEWSRADSLASVYERDPTRLEQVQFLAAEVRIALEAARGSVENAWRILRQAQARAETANRRDRLRRLALLQVLLREACGQGAIRAASLVASDTTLAGQILRGLIAAANGNTLRAEGFLRAIRARPSDELQYHAVGPRLLEALIASGHDEQERASQILGLLARQVEQPSTDLSPPLVRWLASGAFAHRGQPDSAAAYLELSLVPSGLEWQRRLDIRLLSSFAHQRLVILYANLGRLGDARRHFAALEHDFTSPDPQLRHLLSDAQSAVRPQTP